MAQQRDAASANSGRRLVAAIDIGGTFTDIVIYNPSSGKAAVGKYLTTPNDPSIGALAGLRTLLEEENLRFRNLTQAVHATTLAANAIVERKGAPTGLLTTKGFQDILQVGRESRYDIYDLVPEFPEPLVGGTMRRELTERIAATGDTLQPLSMQEVKVTIQELVDRGAKSIAVCLLHSYVNPEHEEAVGEVIAESFPDISYSLSSKVCPEIREYERTSTTVANAYIQPIVSRYLEDLETNLENVALYIMLSNGGISTAKSAAETPIRMFESGPAAGALSAACFGKLSGFNNVVAFDMGGTTAKTCVIENGHPHISTEFEIARVKRFKKGSGLPIQVSCVDLIEVGAGGGSIARIDSMGLLKVGPDSQGASPGPACYGLGGTEPTVTDADLILGYIDPAYFLGGEMEIFPEAASEAIRKKIAEPLKIEEVQAAWGVHELVNETMAAAARIQLSERGKDPRNFTLIATGGAGPVHAFRLARKVGLRRIVCLPAAGLASALGLLVVPIKVDTVDSHVSPLDQVDLNKINALLADREKKCVALLKAAGVREREIRIERMADVSFLGQGFPLTIPIPTGKLGPQHIQVIDKTFRELYSSTHGGVIGAVPLQVMNWRIFGLGPDPKANFKFSNLSERGSRNVLKGTRRIYLPENKGYRKVNVYDRYLLKPGQKFKGPALVEERVTTTVVGSRSTFYVDKTQNLIIEL
ncbi:MAG: hydantoinase/oxoprolinase family protein [Candidatus Tectomicrobia bacterium]|uniref:Hydantoinase/oxoprolinase family protein n=1 Tax=Tectimicrobiota bacterium TaxID=2528274 RepID=A0A932HW94_UNCTE|nr:hydantoinase/oxoprolinase family protein [Candidatus Tectomicrobia bacterium]